MKFVIKKKEEDSNLLMPLAGVQLPTSRMSLHSLTPQAQNSYVQKRCRFVQILYRRNVYGSLVGERP